VESAAITGRESGAAKWWTAADATVLVAYACVVGWTIGYHEKWADEAQAWLIARDLDLRTIWFHELRYEGSPGLWHTILWIAQHVFHAGYDALGHIGAAFAIAGAAVLIFAGPFPRYVRWPLAFTYVMVYQYAVIARPYTLYPLLAFCGAIFFKDTKRPERMTVVLILLTLLTMHGAILAGCLGLAYLVEAKKAWGTLDQAVKTKYWVCIALMACTVLFVAAILKPTPDVEEIALKREVAQAPEIVRQQFPSFGRKITNVISGAFLDWLVPSIIFLILSATWTIWRRKWLAFVLSVGCLIGFYGAVHGAAHHHGTVFIAAVMGLWIAWPDREEVPRFAPVDKVAFWGIQGLLIVLCAINIWDSVVVINREYLYPYSGADDAANYLKAQGADRGPMFGLLFGVVAVQAHFDHNIFVNNPTSYFHHGLPLTTTTLDVDLLNRVKPEYVVAYSMDPQLMIETGVSQLTSRGYELAHFSDGYYLYKQAVFEREVYFIFRRVKDNPYAPQTVIDPQENSPNQGNPRRTSP